MFVFFQCAICRRHLYIYIGGSDINALFDVLNIELAALAVRMAMCEQAHS